MNVKLFLVVLLFTLLNLAASIGCLRPGYNIHQTLPDSNSIVISYNRSTEIENHCSPFLASASELKPDENRGSRLKNELSFHLGDWEQDKNGVPLMQIHDEHIPDSTQSLKLVSFEVNDVNSVQNLKNAVSLGGVLYLGISTNTLFAYGMHSEPRILPGSSVMAIVFEGVYMESKEYGGEGLLCLQGSSTSTLCTNRCESDGNPYNDRTQLQFLEDDQVLLVLHYPKTFKLNKRSIHGEMVSLHEEGRSGYFSKVHIYSQLNGHRKYQFSPELFESRKFDPSPYQDELMEDGAAIFTGRDFCAMLDTLSRGEILNIIANYRFNGSLMNQIHGKLGPFLLGNDMEANGGLTYDNIKLIFQHVKCEQDTTSNMAGISGNAKVSAVLRAFDRKGNYERFEGLRTGLSGLTLAAEGTWNSSSGLLLMVGCQGRVESGFEGCDYEIAMYFPSAFSIKQRSFLFGSIYSLKKGISFDNPLFFDATASSNEFLSRFHGYATYYNLSYNYSKVKLVNRFERRNLPIQILPTVKQLFFQYPALTDGEEPLLQLSMLAGSLVLNGYVVSDDPDYLNGLKSRVLVRIEVLSLGPLLGWYDPTMDKQNQRNKPVITNEDLRSSRFLNVSMHMMFTTEKRRRIPVPYKNISELSLEGLYDPVSGEMNLIGCRKALIDSIGIERGQDCLIEVKIQYPAKNFQWRKHPSSKITISSQRQESDPLYFSLISLDAIVTHYPIYFGTFANREFFEGIVCILLIAGSIAIIWSQLSYMKVDANIVPYISTSMLACQILGYGLPLICGAKVLLKSKLRDAYEALPQGELGMLKVLQSIQNSLLLVALLLTARIFQMVREAQKKPSLEGYPKLRYASRKERLIQGIIAIFMLRLYSWLANPGYYDHLQLQHGIDIYAPRNVQMQQFWMTMIEDFVYEIQDMFLLPQILFNLSLSRPVKSLKKAYYLGFTSIRLLVHFFDHVRDPTLHPNSTSALLAKVVTPTIIILVSAIIVFMQQKWKHHSLSKIRGD
ncbi:hypothetical protein COLO4_34971 [Corchorus olitorius]|uniref:RING-type E3 ubiquitin transferase n=1 Tax=Corchorus olitorius TaxID=93759 RepID=A0A1R3GIR3_9ROSI|nr:hypothetical protein COLO4_34971 [Corchorus olitorius]